MRLYVVAGEDWYRFFRFKRRARRFLHEHDDAIVLTRIKRRGQLVVVEEARRGEAS